MGETGVVKLLIIGDAAVGKSCLLMRFTDDKYDAQNKSTIGIDFRSKMLSIDGAESKLQIWDTAGQEKFRVISRSYYRGAHGIMLCFDLTKRDSFNQIENWMESIHCNIAGNEVSICLIGNKCDDTEHREVETADARAVADRLKIPYFETSAKTGENVEAAFIELTRQAAGHVGPRQGASAVNVVTIEAPKEKGKHKKKGCC